MKGRSLSWQRHLTARDGVTMATLLFSLAVALGILIGLGSFTFQYAEGTSYLSNDPSACANCHIMWEQYDSWTASSHTAVAGCVDCHLPQPTIAKWISKAENGWAHSVAFTLQNYPDPIRIKPRNHAIVQRNCVSCHAAITHEILPTTTAAGTPSCTHCHYDVGHGGWR
jgi:cytochrome c nitrite reductase small subunit